MSARRGRPPKNRSGQGQTDRQSGGIAASATTKDDGAGNRTNNPQNKGEGAASVIPGRPVSPTIEERKERLDNLFDKIKPTFDPGKSDAGFSIPVGSPEAQEQVEQEAQQPKRGRPLGSRNKATISVSGLESLLFGIFTTLAHASSIPELSVSDVECHQIAEAWSECAKYYSVMNLDPAIAAPINLGTTLSIIVGSRVVAYRIRKSTERGALAQHVPQPAQAPVALAPAMRQEQINGVSPGEPAKPIATREMRTGEIPGIGRIEFPPDDPLVSGGRKH